MEYPVTFERDDNDTVLVSFPDFPEAHTFGDDEDDAVVRAQEALATILEAYIADRRRIPSPSARRGHRRVPVPALMEAKVRLYEAMREANVGKAELARRLHWHLPQVDRLFDVRHRSRLDQLEAAAAVLGKRLTVGVSELTTPSRAITPKPRQQKARERPPLACLGKRLI
jgi:antitoxin HicB